MRQLRPYQHHVNCFLAWFAGLPGVFKGMFVEVYDFIN
jgi:hypothetical protein